MINLDLLQKWQIDFWEMEHTREISPEGSTTICPYMAEIRKIKELDLNQQDVRNNAIEAIKIIYKKVVQFVKSDEGFYQNREDKYYLPILQEQFESIDIGKLDTMKLKGQILDFIYTVGRVVDSLYENLKLETPAHLTQLMKISEI